MDVVGRRWSSPGRGRSGIGYECRVVRLVRNLINKKIGGHAATRGVSFGTMQGSRPLHPRLICGQLNIGTGQCKIYRSTQRRPLSMGSTIDNVPYGHPGTLHTQCRCSLRRADAIARVLAQKTRKSVGHWIFAKARQCSPVAI